MISCNMKKYVFEDKQELKNILLSVNTISDDQLPRKRATNHV